MDTRTLSILGTVLVIAIYAVVVHADSAVCRNAQCGLCLFSFGLQ